MARNFIERRIISEGIALCERRVELGGSPISAEDLKEMKVKTFSPWLQIFYIVVGAAFTVFGIWVHIETRSMVQSILPVLIGIGNIAFAMYGRPCKVRDLEGIDLMDLSAEIVQRFVKKMDSRNAKEQ